MTVDVLQSPSRSPSSTRDKTKVLTSGLHYEVNDIPKWNSLLLFALQQSLLCISGLLVIPFLVSNIACAGDQTIALRVKLIAATFVTSGIATIIQTTFGLRLCILHGPSFAFLPPLIAFAALPENECKVDLHTTVPEEIWISKITTIQGSLLSAVAIMIVLGSTGLVGIFARYVGPITITPLLLLLTIGTIPTAVQKIALHWISGVELALLITMTLLLENFYLPIPYYSIKERRMKITRMRVFGQFPYLIGISAAWIICFILSKTDLEPVEGEARIDKNATLSVLSQSPWFQIPYPFQFGSMKFSTGLFLGFLASTLACMMESIGDYEMCAKISHQRHPPVSSINRAIICEGVGAVLAAIMGVGTGVTTYAENIAIMQITKVASRATMQVAGIILILLGCFTKCAAILASIPDAVVGGVLAMGMAMIMGVAVSNLQTVDLRVSRNLTVIGVALLLGCVIPDYIEEHPIKTDNMTLNNVLGMLLKIKMLIGGLIAFFLDNVVPGATKYQRGFQSTEEDKTNLDSTNDGYALPEFILKLIERFPVLSCLPFLPSPRRSLIV
ncbi:unnamed protein product [Auanema sp. JU1783]|nr:unnamed protein product [Auanema sp. JU1783]